MRRLLLFGGISVLLSAVVGAAGLSALAGGGEQSGSPQGEVSGGTPQNDAIIRGGPIDRFHGAGGCGLAGIAGLSGNWTHGDYVTAAVASGDPALVLQAAHSDCGKPITSTGHGGGPPAHALAHAAKGLEKAEKAKRAPAEKAERSLQTTGGS
jgi:hypothetical protein